MMNKSKKVYQFYDWEKSKKKNFEEFCPKDSFVSFDLFYHFTSGTFGEEIYFYGAGCKIQLCPITREVNGVKKYHTFFQNNLMYLHVYMGLMTIEEAKKYAH